VNTSPLIALLGLLLASSAQAQDLGLGFSCESETVGDTTRWTDGTSRRRCSIDYSNFSGDDIANVRIRFTTEDMTTSGFASALPDGVPGLTDSDTQTWNLFGYASQVAGSPIPSWNGATHTATFIIANIPDNTASEIQFDLYPSQAFPQASVQMDIIASITGVDDGAGISHTHIWDQSYPQTQAHPIARSQASRHFVGGSRAKQNSRSNAQSNARLRIHMPYWDGSAWHSDDGFNRASHTPVIAASDLGARLTLLGNSYTSDIVLDMAAGALTGPSTGPNAGRHIVYDPDTNSLTGEIGPWWAAESLSTDYRGHADWVLRYDGSYNPSLPANALAPDTSIPIEVCFESDQTGLVSSGNPSHCQTQNTQVVEDEALALAASHIFCPGSNSWAVACQVEGRPFLPGSTGTTTLRINNDTSLTGDATVYTQVPGDHVNGRIVDVSYLAVGIGPYAPGNNIDTGNYAADAVRMFVSTTPADYTGNPTPTDLPSRALPASGTTWTECDLSENHTNSVLICDGDSLPFALSDIEQVRLELDGMNPRSSSLQELFNNEAWVLEMRWTLHQDAPATIDGLFTDQTDTALATLGVASRFDMELTNGDFESASNTITGEVSTESKVLPCGVFPGFDTGTDFSLPASCRGNGYSGTSAVVNDVRGFKWGVGNVGTLPNVIGPAEICTPVPVGLRFENTIDPNDRMRPAVGVGPRNASTADATATLLELSQYTYTYIPDTTDPTVDGELCVQINDATLVLQPGAVVAANAVIRFVPSVNPRAQFRYSDWRRGMQTIQGQDAGGNAIQHSVTANPGYYDISGVSRIETSTIASPGSPVGPNTELCYDFEHDSHAFANDGSSDLDPGWSRLPSHDGVSYIWIPDASESDPGSVGAPNSGTATLTGVSSPDAIATWIQTDNTPSFGDATTLTANGWQPCTTGNTACDAAALSGLGLTNADVRWVAVEFGTLDITDAEPRGVAPFDSNTRFNNVYTLRVCMLEGANASTETTLRTVIETYTSNLLPVLDEPIDIIANPDCPDGLVQQATDEGQTLDGECDGVDNDCDGLVDEDTIVNTDCSAGVGECWNSGTYFCNSGMFECNVEPFEGSEELCDGLDNDCDGTADETWTGLGDDCGIGIGECAASGTVVCTPDQTDVECDAEVIEPTAELCDGLDRDCDGDPLNGFGTTGSECSVGIGACATTGNWICLADGSDVECDVDAGVAIVETCDGTDGDCDGIVDGSITDNDSLIISACADTDNDGITDHTEYFGPVRTDYLNADTDNDGVQDGTEQGYTTPEFAEATDTNVFVPDVDPQTTTDPLDADTDDDGLLDGTEDADGNGAVDDSETDPLNPDTDADGLFDGTESGLTTPESDTDTDTTAGVYVADADPNITTDPLRPDTDADGLFDGVEDTNLDGAVDFDETDPTDDDSDDDGLLDGTEDYDQDGTVDQGETDPLNNDTDADNIQDGTESGIDTPQGNDTDTTRFVPDADPSTTTDPLNNDTDAGSIREGVEDANYNGAYEPALGECDPNDPSDDLNCVDSDGDGLSDYAEGELGTDPSDDDTDDDCITDGNEITNGTNPLNTDTDGDGVQDGTESGLTGPQGNDTDESICQPDQDSDTTTDPLDDDSDDDGLTDGAEDADGDGLVDATETDPNDEDTDDGGVPDGQEVEEGKDPLDGDDDIDDEVPEQWVQGGIGCQTGGAPPWLVLVLLATLAVRRKQVA
jgi:hypothetical protein